MGVCPRIPGMSIVELRCFIQLDGGPRSTIKAAAKGATDTTPPNPTKAGIKAGHADKHREALTMWRE